MTYTLTATNNSTGTVERTTTYPNLELALLVYRAWIDLEPEYTITLLDKHTVDFAQQ